MTPALLLALVCAGPLGAEDGHTFETCTELLRTRPSERGTASCFYEFARLEGGGGRSAAMLAERSRDSASPWFSFYRGNLLWSDTDEALELFDWAIRGFRDQREPRGEVLARINRSQLLARRGDTAAELAELQSILAVTRESKDPWFRGWDRVIRARLLHTQGEDLETAYRLIAGLEIPATLEDSFSLRRDRLITLRLVCASMGRFDEAREANRNLVDLSQDLDPRSRRYLQANAAYSLATLLYSNLLDRPTRRLHQETLTAAKEALETAALAEHRAVEALAAGMLGMLTPGEEGRELLRRCYRTAEGANVRSYCLGFLAERLAASDPGAARESLTMARRLAEESGDGITQIRVWQSSMRVAWSLDSPAEARDESWRALEAIESLRDRQPVGSATQAEIFSVWSDEYAWLAGRLLQDSHGAAAASALAAAFHVAERRRARALTDWLHRAHQSSVADSPPDRYGLADLATVRARLAPEEALLSFQVAPWRDLTGAFAGGSWVLVITRDAVTSHRLPGRVEVRHGVRRFEAAIAGRGDGGGREARLAADLHGDLLTEALAELPESVDRLVLVPDDALHRLPFAALRASADGEPLGARYELVQVPSATLWLRWRDAAPVAAPEPLLVLADPEPPGATGGEGEPALQLAAARGRASDRSAGEVFERLPHARREGRAALRALGGGLLLIGADASEAAVRRLPLRDYAVLHVAGHARNDEDRPERSMVVLAAAEGEGGPAGDRDGYLRSAEIARLDLGGRAVVLAVCESADGSTLRGEGVMSLGRAFFQSGAHTVVASLWRLRDDDSAAMFDRFYRHLGRGESVAAALHAARAEAIEAGEPAAAWAGLVVLGDGSLVPVPGGRGGAGELLGAPVTLALAAAALVGIALALLAARRRSRSV